MKFEKFNLTQILISILSCSLFISAVVVTWNANPGVCLLLLIYLIIFLIYFFYNWRFKEWKEPGVQDEDQLKRALKLKSMLKNAHSLFLFLLIFIPVLCAILLLLRSTLPDYTNDLINKSFTKQEYKNVLGSQAISIITPDTSCTSSKSSFVASIHYNKGAAYPITPFMSIVLQNLFDPVWNFAWSALIWIFVFLTGVWFAEFIGGTIFKFT